MKEPSVSLFANPCMLMRLHPLGQQRVANIARLPSFVFRFACTLNDLECGFILCIACMQCMLMYALSAAFFGSGALSLPPAAVATKGVRPRMYIHTGTGAVVLPRVHNPRGISTPNFARGFQAPAIHTTAHSCFVQQLLAGQAGIHIPKALADSRKFSRNSIC